ncbi:MAG: radical SAM protein [Elusimicrobia bacterium]|nr:radical SAM protein [Elusimicrobiota bacterium]
MSSKIHKLSAGAAAPGEPLDANVSPRLSSGAKLAMAVLKAGLARLPAGAPHSVFLGLTSRCDLACRHCKYAGARRTGRKADMPARLLGRLLREAAGAGIPRVVFFGGEPLLYPGLEKAVAAASRLGLFTELDTNGQALTAARVGRLASAGLSSVMISLHSHAPSRHDALSGAGSFRRAVGAVRAARRAGLITYISTCVFSGSLPSGDLAALLSFAKKSGAHGARLLAYAPPRGASRLPAELAAGLRGASPDGYARTCARPGRGGCAATLGEVLFFGPGGEARSCPYAAKPLGRAGRLGGFLGGTRAASRFPCQKPFRVC